MKAKGIKITIILVASIFVIALIFFAIIFFSGCQITVARGIVSDSGSLYMVYNDSPVRLNYGDEKEYETGDKLLILHQSAFAESYPEQTRAYFIMKIGSGLEEDIPQKVFDVLIDTGNYSVSDIGGADGPQNTSVKTVEGNMKTYYEMSDGTWQCNSHTYKHRLVITGRQPSSLKDTTYVYLSNIEEISFQKAMMASGLSSNTEDYFNIEDAVLVELY